MIRSYRIEPMTMEHIDLSGLRDRVNDMDSVAGIDRMSSIQEAGCLISHNRIDTTRNIGASDWIR